MIDLFLPKQCYSASGVFVFFTKTVTITGIYCIILFREKIDIILVL